jgi:NTP pyrophosphatase (non-canonical NTP hydrolase)
MTTIDEVLNAAVETWGVESQTAMAIGEIGEFLTLIGRKAQGRLTLEEVHSEIADVIIMMKQMAKIWGENQVAEQITYKVGRLKQKLIKQGYNFDVTNQDSSPSHV